MRCANGMAMGYNGSCSDRRGQTRWADTRRANSPSDFKRLLFAFSGELILFFGLGRGELFEVRVATAAMVVT